MKTDTPSYIARPEDKEFYERELASFIPDKVFDAHTHVWHSNHCQFPEQFPPVVDYQTYIKLMEDIHPGRITKALFIPTFRDPQSSNPIRPRPSFITDANQWTSDQTAKDQNCRGHFFIKPDDDPEWVRQEVKRLGLCGLKCYHSLSLNPESTFEAQIPDYLPETLSKVAHDQEWTITLHMVRARGAADPGNIHWIRHYCENYPKMQLILAHSARGFQPAHNLEGLPQLTGLDNLWFDTSANCEAMAHQAIIRIIGHDKLLYGGDLPVTHGRGRSLGVQDSFLWLYEDSPGWGEKHQSIKPVFTGLEHLRSIKWACWSENLTDNQIEDIFWNNAAKLFRLS